ncbi:DUF6896 domain-containing protein [Spirosoma fluminis]
MLSKEKILLDIQAYKATIDEVNTVFLQYCNGWNLDRLPKHGELGTIKYEFHGIGCRTEKLGQAVDFDYSLDESFEPVTAANIHLMVSEFDIHRFFNFVKSSPDHVNLHELKINELKPLFDELVIEGKLEKNGSWHFVFPSYTAV